MKHEKIVSHGKIWSSIQFKGVFLSWPASKYGKVLVSIWSPNKTTDVYGRSTLQVKEDFENKNKDLYFLHLYLLLSYEILLGLGD